MLSGADGLFELSMTTLLNCGVPCTPTRSVAESRGLELPFNRVHVCRAHGYGAHSYRAHSYRAHSVCADGFCVDSVQSVDQQSPPPCGSPGHLQLCGANTHSSYTHPPDTGDASRTDEPTTRRVLRYHVCSPATTIGLRAAGSDTAARVDRTGSTDPGQFARDGIA
jgi:hypothetical protein